MCTLAYNIRKWRPTQRTATWKSCEQLFDHDKFEAMKMLSSWEAARCDEHQFCAKIKVSAGAILELSFFEKHEK